MRCEFNYDMKLPETVDEVTQNLLRSEILVRNTTMMSLEKWRLKVSQIEPNSSSKQNKCLSSSISDNNTKSSTNANNNWRRRDPSETNGSEELTTMSCSANCDNYNTMCQLYESINSAEGEKLPMIKLSRAPPPPPPRLLMPWNKFSTSRRRQQQTCHWNSLRITLTQTVIVLLLLAICPQSAWCWSAARRNPSFYQQSSEDYYADGPEKPPFLVSNTDELLNEDGPPVFGKAPRLIEGTVGQTVIMSCVVYNLAAKRVTWMRMKDLQILTHGPLLFTSDVRVSSERPYGDNTRWGLVISDLRLEDSGKYECQVNSDPEMKLEVELVVREQQQSDMPFEPAGRTVIEGPREEVVKQGTVVVFSCSARNHLSKSEQIKVVWLKDGSPIDKFETARGGVSVITDWLPTSVTSQLTLITASSSDNGVYSCTVPGSGTDKVTLFIDEAEAQANTLNMGNRIDTLVPGLFLILICTYTLVAAVPLMHL